MLFNEKERIGWEMGSTVVRGLWRSAVGSMVGTIMVISGWNVMILIFFFDRGGKGVKGWNE